MLIILTSITLLLLVFSIFINILTEIRVLKIIEREILVFDHSTLLSNGRHQRNENRMCGTVRVDHV